MVFQLYATFAVVTLLAYALNSAKINSQLNGRVQSVQGQRVIIYKRNMHSKSLWDKYNMDIA